MHGKMHHCLSDCSKLKTKMTIKFCLFDFLLLLFINYGNTQGNISLSPANPLYWLDSYIKITCRTYSPNIKVKECSWFINDSKVSNGEIYQFSVDEKERECVMTVKLAATAKNGKWRCLLHLSATSRISDLSASTNVAIFELTLREFVIIICGVPIFLAMSLIIAGLIMKNRRQISPVEPRNCFVASAPVVLEGGLNGEMPPPPSYDTVFGDRMLTDQLARLEFSGFHNCTEGRSSLHDNDEPGNFEPAFKSRSAPTLVVA
ncbi:Uncharacterized protein APZ42_014780 [Daphnia magna]|uniref:Uncharacterized protein n=1 Tax=Daphnia magna TaxID=35525 RepID=A0A162PL80_9CRUS|nr:Uncharacterized protein APZ42_014780 [Daphnia magna]